MPLLPDELKKRLPELYSQRDEPDPVVYARLYMPGTSLNFYVIEGDDQAGYWVLFCCYVTGEEWGFSPILLDFLESIRGPDGQAVILDSDFHEGPLTDVVPAPDL